LRPVGGITLLRRLDFGELGQDGGMAGDPSPSFLLGFESEPAFSLLVGRDAIIRDIPGLFRLFWSLFSSDIFPHVLQTNVSQQYSRMIAPSQL
jgi:hypothetical protein